MTEVLPVSIIIPTFNRASFLDKALVTCFAQRCAEVIIVDDGSDPPVASVTDPDGVTKVTQIRNDHRRQQPVARMQGVEAASQPYILFSEDDVLLPEGHAANLLAHIREGVADIVAARLVTTSSFERLEEAEGSRAGAPRNDLSDLTINTDATIHTVERVRLLHSVAMMKREIAQRLGFDDRFSGNAFREETDFYLRAWKEGLTCAFVPGVPAFHYKGLDLAGGQHERGILWSLLRYEYWVARNNLHLLRKHETFLRDNGLPTHPRRDTLRMMLRRTVGYPGRIREKVRRARFQRSGKRSF